MVACGGGSSTGANDPARTVQGTRQITYVTDAGTQTVPDDTTNLTIAALVPNGSGGYATIAGTDRPDGSFTIPNVPTGNYLLQSGCCTFVSTTSSTPDTGYSQLGRARRQLPTLPTQIALSVSNANPLQANDDLQSLRLQQRWRWLLVWPVMERHHPRIDLLLADAALE